MTPRRAVVVGAGVIGLSSAIRLAERGWDVQILTRDLPQRTTSSAAGAIWHPYAVHPMERAMAWGRASLEVFYQLIAAGTAGVTLIPLCEYYTHPVEQHWADGLLRSVERVPPDMLPPGAVDGFRLEMPIVQMDVYLRYLVKQLAVHRVPVDLRTVNSLDEVRAPDRLVIHCTGVGAKTVAQDASVFPIRGQVLKAQAPAVQQGVLFEWGEQGVTYIFPRPDGVILGGVVQRDNWSLEADPADSASILERCLRLDSALEGAPILSTAVGLRPGRPAVRLEPETGPDGAPVIHNYGHGGAGVTLSWGCAAEVAALAEVYRSR